MVFIGLLICLLSLSTSYIQYRAVSKIEDQFGSHLSYNINVMSIFIKGVKDYISVESPTKPGSEKIDVTKDELLKLSGSAQSFSLQSNSIQVVAVFTGHLKVLSSKLYELAQIIGDPTQQQRRVQLNNEVLFIADTIDKSLDLIQQSGESNTGTDSKYWYSMNTDIKHPVYLKVKGSITPIESGWKLVQ